MLGRDIESRARIVLNDADAVRWPASEFPAWITDGSRFIALLRPDSTSVNATHSLVAGTKQTIPAGGLRFLDAKRNLTTNRAVRLVERDVLDSQQPNWHADTPTSAVKNFVFDNRDPKTFYVSPPASTGTQLEILYSRAPTAITTVGELDSVTLSLDDIYLDPLLNYVLARAYEKDATFAQNAALAKSYRAECLALLGIKTGSDARFSPDLNTAGAQPKAGTRAGGV